MKPFSLDHLSETEFEEFCFDLLHELGFINIQWRKGTGLSTSPSDRGRDIQCQRENVEIDGSKYFETWFIECKHFTKGVPPEKLQGVLSWASAERPDKLLIITSNFLSNPAHDHLKIYEENNRPSFKILVWQKPDLEKIAFGKSKLLTKYNISDDLVFLPIVHPMHLLYLKDFPINSLAYFFAIVENLEPKYRDSLLEWVYHVVIMARYREPVTGTEKLEDLRIDEVSYKTFKAKLQFLAKFTEEHLLVFSVVSWTAQSWLRSGNLAEIDKTTQKFTGALNFANALMEDDGESDSELWNFYRDMLVKMGYKGSTDKMKESIEKASHSFNTFLENLQETTQTSYDNYTFFCENVISKLFLEDVFSRYLSRTNTTTVV